MFNRLGSRSEAWNDKKDLILHPTPNAYKVFDKTEIILIAVIPTQPPNFNGTAAHVRFHDCFISRPTMYSLFITFSPKKHRSPWPMTNWSLFQLLKNNFYLLEQNLNAVVNLTHVTVIVFVYCVLTVIQFELVQDKDNQWFAQLLGPRLILFDVGRRHFFNLKLWKTDCFGVVW
jgi:hypothetical protein